MAEGHMKDWERLLTRALAILDAAHRMRPSGFVWTLGGGSVLSRRLRHRRSAGVDIFLTDARMLPFVSPRFTEGAGAVSVDYVEGPTSVRVYFHEGEIAFIACPLVTSDPLRRETLLGRPVPVETTGEILAKKLWHRAACLAARDLFDFAAVEAMEPNALRGIGGMLKAQRAHILQRLQEHGEGLREDFAALNTWEFSPSFEECAAALRSALARSSPPPAVEERRLSYLAADHDGSAQQRLEVRLIVGESCGPPGTPG